MTLNELRESLELHEKRQERADKKYKAARKGSASAKYWLLRRKLEWPIIQRRKAQIRKKSKAKLTTIGGAKGIVDSAFAVGRQAGGESIYVGSSLRPGSSTSSGNVSDHSRNDATRAARDIGFKGRNLLTGPPAPDLDKAAVAIGKAFGRNYGDGKHRIVDTFYWRGYRVQIIWRTPEYGGHMGHIHIGVRRS